MGPPATDWGVRSDTIKLLEESIGRTLFDRIRSKNFFDLSSKAKATKAKSPTKNKWDLIKLKSFCKVKETTD